MAQFGCDVEMVEQARSFVMQRIAGGNRATVAAQREPAGQQHVIRHGQVGNQVELLEHKTDVIGAHPVTSRRRHRGQFVAEQRDRSSFGCQHTAQQSEQCALAAAAGAVYEDAVACFGMQFLRYPGRRVRLGIAKGQILDLDNGIRHDRSTSLRAAALA